MREKWENKVNISYLKSEWLQPKYPHP
jgi:hypothetical protein